MGKRLLIVLLTVLPLITQAQIVRIEPADASGDDEFKIIYDATQGTAGLVGESKVYMHSGVIIDGPEGEGWTNVVGNWGQDDGVGEMTPVSGQTDLWEITLSPSARDYYNIANGTNMFRLGMVFRNSDGTKEGKGTPGSFEGGFVGDNQDIYIDLNVDEFITITSPPEQEVYYVINGNSIELAATASNPVSTMSVSVDEGSGYTQLATVNTGTTISYLFTPTQSFDGQLRFDATISGIDVEAIQPFKVELIDPIPELPLPAGIQKGINYHPGDDTKVTLVLEAPNKTIVHAVGDFSNWQAQEQYIMNKTPDGEMFWIELNGLTPGEEYVFQYWVDGIIKVGDPYTDKVADPWNDQSIPASVHDAIPVYNRPEYGIASTFQTAQVPYDWGANEASWVRPDKEDLIVYELLVRDFVGTHDYKTLIDTLGYLKNLGVNAIELMPIMEFEGNESWGYNPMYFFAVDKYYGTKNDLKDFIKACHEEGIAVILDMVMNHAFGLNSMVQLYREEPGNAGSKPTPDNPWFNPDPKHPFNVGFDFNHESDYTKALLDSVNRYWIEEYHFDGYRFDLSKGFTQTFNTDVGAWSDYDQSRIDLLERMANKIWEVDADAYVILEHFAAASEESALTGMGMLSWRNLVFNYYLPLGGHTQADFSGARVNTHVAYMESHDEQRQIWEVQNSSDFAGRSEGPYNTQATIVALDRLKQNAAFIYLLPGPKMLWQFGELGYDIDINENGRTGNKPLPWGPDGLGYYEDPERFKVYQAFSAIIKLRTENSEAFRTGLFTTDLSSETRKIKMESSDFDLVVVGNFGLETEMYSGQFTQTGTWYDYITGEELDVPITNTEIELLPGEFRIYTSERLSQGFGDIVNVYNGLVTNIRQELPGFNFYPNPTTGLVSFEGDVPGSPKAITIQNAAGKIIDTIILEDRQLRPVDLSRMDPGLYLLRIITDERYYTLKVLKQ
jgi:glycosidase